MIAFVILSLLVASVVMALYLLTRIKRNHYETYSYWRERHMPEISERCVLNLGHVSSVFMLKESLSEVLFRLHVASAGHRVVGFYFRRRPALLIRDPLLMRRVLVSHRASFAPFARPSSELDPLLEFSSLFGPPNSPFRQSFTPERVKAAYNAITYMVFKMLTDVQRTVEATPGDDRGYRDFNLDKVFTDFSVSVMLRFGLGERSVNSPNAKRIRKVGWSLASFLENPGRLTQHVYCRYFNHKAEMLREMFDFRPSIVPESVEHEFREAVLGYLDTYRQDPDLLFSDCLINWIHKDKYPDKDLDDEEIVRMLFAFFLEVYLVNAVTGSLAIYQLADHMSVVYSLRMSMIKHTSAAQDVFDWVNYETQSQMPYLDAVINETMRLHPIVGAVERICLRKIVYKPVGQQEPIKLRDGQLVFISTHGLHREPKIWKKPNEFHPRRFSVRSASRRPFVPFPGMHEPGPHYHFHWACLRTLIGMTMGKFGFARVPGHENAPPPCSNKTFIRFVKRGLRLRIRMFEAEKEEMEKLYPLLSSQRKITSEEFGRIIAQQLSAPQLKHTQKEIFDFIHQPE